MLTLSGDFELANVYKDFTALICLKAANHVIKLD